MPDPSTLLVFVAASAALVAIPGPSVVFIVTRSLEGGRRAGLVSTLGVETGALLHVAAAALGLSAVLTSSATAFTIVRYVGAAYLIFLGVQALRRHGVAADDGAPAPPAGRLFRQGVLVNALNPKVAVFFLAFLPQFVDPSQGAVAAQIVSLGLVFVVIALLGDGAYAVVAAGLGGRLRRSASARRRLGRLSGAVHLLLGGAAAVAGERPRP